ncbi:transcriptional regulator, HxlR family protein [Chondrocystis sp. NIES-4102]|nr:transcriptional regulator, HxlR family protein [Chondrocystis sp. NIES-4102]
MDYSKAQSDITQKYLPQPTLDRVAITKIFDTTCAAHQILEYIANKWTILIIFALTQDTKRYNQLKQQIVGISPKMLIQNLRNLERCGLIERKIYPTVPPKVEYSLTTLGRSLVEPIAVMGEWAYQNIEEVKVAIQAYDAHPSNEYWKPK